MLRQVSSSATEKTAEIERENTNTELALTFVLLNETGSLKKY